MSHSDGGAGGFPIGDGPAAPIHAPDANAAEISPFDHGACGHTHHDRSAFVSLDHTLASDVPLEAVVLSEPTTWSLHDIESRPKKVGFWRRLGRALLLLNGG